MAKTLNKAEIKTIATEVYSEVSKIQSKKRQEYIKAKNEGFEGSAQKEKFLEVCSFLGEDPEVSSYRTSNLKNLFLNHYEDTLEPLSFNSKSIGSIEHDISLQQIKRGGGEDLDKLLEQLIIKYTQ